MGISQGCVWNSPYCPRRPCDVGEADSAERQIKGLGFYRSYDLHSVISVNGALQSNPMKTHPCPAKCVLKARWEGKTERGAPGSSSRHKGPTAREKKPEPLVLRAQTVVSILQISQRVAQTVSGHLSWEEKRTPGSGRGPFTMAMMTNFLKPAGTFYKNGEDTRLEAHLMWAGLSARVRFSTETLPDATRRGKEGKLRHSGREKKKRLLPTTVAFDLGKSGSCRVTDSRGIYGKNVFGGIASKGMERSDRVYSQEKEVTASSTWDVSGPPFPPTSRPSALSLSPAFSQPSSLIADAHLHSNLPFYIPQQS